MAKKEKFKRKINGVKKEKEKKKKKKKKKYKSSSPNLSTSTSFSIISIRDMSVRSCILKIIWSSSLRLHLRVLYDPYGWKKMWDHILRIAVRRLCKGDVVLPKIIAWAIT